MSIKSDKWIRRMAQGHGMIEPFEPGQVRQAADGHRIVSYGTSSYGYDIRRAREFKVFTNIYSTVVDPKAFDERSLEFLRARQVMTGQKPASGQNEEIGFTQSFVLARGFVTVDGFDALIGHDGTRRVFAQLTADPDRPEVRPNDAYLNLLNSMQPGWVLRVLQIFWPDAMPRTNFYELVERWPEPKTEGLSILMDGLKLAVQQQGVPYTRKTVIEFVYRGPEGSPWWQSVPEICAVHGVQVKYLLQEEVEALAHWIFNPSLVA